MKISGINGCADNYRTYYVMGMFLSLIVLTGLEIYALHFSVLTREVFGNAGSWLAAGLSSGMIQFASLACFFGAINMKRKGSNNALPALLLGMVVFVGFECIWIVPHIPEALASAVGPNAQKFIMSVCYFALVMLVFLELKLFLQTEIDQYSGLNPHEYQAQKLIIDAIVKQSGHKSMAEAFAASVMEGKSDTSVGKGGKVNTEEEELKELEKEKALPAGN